MAGTISLCFSKAGLLNPSQLKHMEDIDAVILFGDGSPAALDAIIEMAKDLPPAIAKVDKVGIGITPKYNMRVISQDGELSKPNFLYDEDTKYKWFSKTIAAPQLDLYISDTYSRSSTRVKLEDDLIASFCYRAHLLWKLLLIVESTVAFPAVAMDQLLKLSYHLNPETMDVEVLRQETGIDSLEYNVHTNMLSVTLAGELFTVKLSFLNDVFEKMILPKFNGLYGRRLSISACIRGQDGTLSEPVDMSYGELGRIIEDMHHYVKEEIIDADHPMGPIDLVEFVKRVEINAHNCIWVEEGESLLSTIETHRHTLVSRSVSNDTDGLDMLGDTTENHLPKSVING